MTVALFAEPLAIYVNTEYSTLTKTGQICIFPKSCFVSNKADESMWESSHVSWKQHCWQSVPSTDDYALFIYQTSDYKQWQEYQEHTKL